MSEKESSISVNCPVCRKRNKIKIRFIYDGGDHFFECRKCGQELGIE